MVTSIWNNLNHHRICPSCDAKLQAHINAHMHCDTVSRDDIQQPSSRYPTLNSKSNVPISIQTQSRLLCLPGELRNKIYEYAFSDHLELSLDKVSLLRIPWSDKVTLPVALQICRQTRAEAFSLWLTSAVFWFNFHGELYEFLRMLGPGKVMAIRSMHESYLWQNRSQAECSLHQLERGLGYYNLSVSQESIAVQYQEEGQPVEGGARSTVCIRRLSHDQAGGAELQN